jgi:hypothetical protein
LIAAWVGLDPKKDLTMIDVFGTEAVDLFAAGKLDAYMAFPPEVQLNRWPRSRETENSSSPPRANDKHVATVDDQHPLEPSLPVGVPAKRATKRYRELVVH